MTWYKEYRIKGRNSSGEPFKGTVREAKARLAEYERYTDVEHVLEIRTVTLAPWETRASTGADE